MGPHTTTIEYHLFLSYMPTAIFRTFIYDMPQMDFLRERVFPMFISSRTTKQKSTSKFQYQKYKRIPSWMNANKLVHKSMSPTIPLCNRVPQSHAKQNGFSLKGKAQIDSRECSQFYTASNLQLTIWSLCVLSCSVVSDSSRPHGL